MFNRKLKARIAELESRLKNSHELSALQSNETGKLKDALAAGERMLAVQRRKEAPTKGERL